MNMDINDAKNNNPIQAEKYPDADKKTIRDIISNYIQNEKALVDQLYFKTGHGATIGSFREDIWRQMFEQIVPKKFIIEQSVFIMDSDGRISNEVDLAIFDETYTPYIFRYGRLKFLPIEAVAVAVECKSTSMNNKKLANWADNIRRLQTCRESYARMNYKMVCGKDVEKKEYTQTATRPLRILCCLNEKISNAPLSSFNDESMFDCVIKVPKNKKLQIKWDRKISNLQGWYHSLNHAQRDSNIDIDNGDCLENVHLNDYQVYGRCMEENGKSKGKEKTEEVPVSLLTFNLQLNQLLMLINNPILFPHIAYARLFNESERG